LVRILEASSDSLKRNGAPIPLVEPRKNGERIVPVIPQEVAPLLVSNGHNGNGHNGNGNGNGHEAVAVQAGI
jgi:hypothetical protein